MNWLGFFLLKSFYSIDIILNMTLQNKKKIYFNQDPEINDCNLRLVEYQFQKGILERHQLAPSDHNHSCLQRFLESESRGLKIFFQIFIYC